MSGIDKAAAVLVAVFLFLETSLWILIVVVISCQKKFRRTFLSWEEKKKKKVDVG